MTISPRPYVSFIMATHNRRAVVEHTLGRVAECGLGRGDYEIIVVDNASDDGTPDCLSGQVSTLICLEHNAGSCAKALGLEAVRGRYVVFLDDDSHPQPGTVERMIERFEQEPLLGAAGFTVHLPDGRQESSALPGVFVGCGVGLRTIALRQVGGLDPSFFMQAEEYDLSFQLAEAGWQVEVFDDLHVEHLKTATARRSERTTFLDIRNNLRVAARWLPAPYYAIYRREFLQRYRWLAEHNGHVQAFRRGVRAGRLRESRERWMYRRRRLGSEVFERFFRLHEVKRRMADLRQSGVKKIILAELGKNVYAFDRGARRAGIAISAIADNRFAAPRRQYHGTDVLTLADALKRDCDAVVISNMSAAHAREAYLNLQPITAKPVFDWFGRTTTRPAEKKNAHQSSPLADIAEEALARDK